MPKLPIGNNAADSIFDAFKSGKIKKDSYEAFNGVYDPGKNNITEAMDALRISADRQKFLAAKSAQKFDELGMKMDTQESGSTFMSNLVSPAFRANSSEINIDMRKQSVSNLLKKNTAEMDEALSTRLYRGLGYDQEAQDNFITAILDPQNPNIDPKSRRIGAAATKAMDEAFDMFNAAGGDMRKIEGGYIPQGHDTAKMMDLPSEMKAVDGTKESRIIQDAITAREKWIAFTQKHLDAKKMGFDKASPEKIRIVLEEIYDTIASGGLNKVKAAITERIKIIKHYDSLVRRGEDKNAAAYKEKFQIKDGEKVGDVYAAYKTNPMAANARKQHRELHYTADGFKAYQREYGQADVFKTISDYIEGMSMDIASMQVLGPNPDHVWNKLKEKAKIDEKVTGSKEHLQGMFDVATGKTDRLAAESGGEKFMASTGGGFRSLGVASDLGGAVISSLTDPMLSSITAGHIGMSPLGVLSSQIGTIFRRIAKGFSVSEKELFAQRIGIVNDSFMASIKNNRFSEGGGPQWIQKMADGVLRSSGLTAWTNALRTSFALEMSGLLADNIGKSLDSFKFGKHMKEIYGLNDADWMKLTKEDLTSFEKGGFLDTTKIYMKDEALALRLMDIINQETNYAVIMPDSRVRSITTGGGAGKGTIQGEAARTALMYKSFPIAMITSHIGRALGMKTISGKLAYGGAMVVGGASVGSMVVQLKEVMKGRDPIKMDDPEAAGKLMFKGLMQSGGLGIIGDLLFSDATRYGGGMVSSLVGKAAQPLEDFDNVFKKPIQKGEYEEIPGEFVKSAMRYVPGRNLWYTRLLYERYISDNMKKLVDPDFDKRLRRSTKKMQKETGQGYWSKPGTDPFTESRSPASPF